MTAFEQMEANRLSEQKDTLLRRLADTEAENTVSYVIPTKCTLVQLMFSICLSFSQLMAECNDSYSIIETAY